VCGVPYFPTRSEYRRAPCEGRLWSIFFILVHSCWVESWDILGHVQRLHLRLVAYIEGRKGLSVLRRAILRPLVLIRDPSDSLNPAFASIIYQYSRKRFVVAKKLYEWNKNVSH
jgi:hypothetical protein